MTRTLSEIFSLDLRSLALMRVGLALVLLFDLFTSLRFVSLFYSDSGLLPRSSLVAHSFHNFVTSLYVAGGWWPYSVLLLGVQLAFAVALLLGYRTRLATAASFIMLLWLHQRNPLLITGGDVWIKAGLFWMIFVPWGAYWSWDSRGREKPHPQVCSVASLGFVLQAISVWLVAGWVKSGPAWTQDGSAISGVLQTADVQGGVAGVLLYFPGLLSGLTGAVLILERFGPFLLLCPWAFGPVRTVVALLFTTFHLGLYLGISLHTFGAVGACTAFGLLPGWAWTQLRVGRSLERRLDQVTSPSGVEAITVMDPLSSFRGRTSAHSPVVFLLLSLVLVSCLVQNLNSLWPRVPKPKVLDSVTLLLGLEQNWRLFAPGPPETSLGVVFEGVTSRGKKILLDDLGRQLSAKSPPKLGFSHLRLRQFGSTLSKRKHSQGLAEGYTRAVVRRWNRKNPGNPLRELNLHLLWAPILPGFEDSPPRRRLLYRYRVK